MATIKDVAKKAGVSTATVSRVVNNGPKVGDKTRARVLAIMAQLGYHPNENARALVTKKSQSLGVVIPDLTDPFFASLANGVDKIARQNNMQLLLSTGSISEESERQAISFLLERRCESIVVHSKKLSDQEIIEFANKIPGLVLIDRFIQEIADKCIWLDNQEGGKIAARHLLSLGHKQLACISSKYKIDDPALRFKGFRNELTESGLSLLAHHIVEDEPNLQGGEVATQKLLASDTKFDAIFVYNDAMAIGAISTLEDNGFKVPIDVSVIGFDDVLLSRYSRPKLTTLHYPIEEMAEFAAQLALGKISAPATEQGNGHKYIPRLVKRESTSLKT
ncbi:MAG: LacI family DNA-binding transcriptional regulator [Paraglaciecola sp.]|uniref:LacI family DNA-binding transcriptional regulator n=1 Tax=Paraglaciecola sp. TaxID=1920173 RepID=UPI003298586D